MKIWKLSQVIVKSSIIIQKSHGAMYINDIRGGWRTKICLHPAC